MTQNSSDKFIHFTVSLLKDSTALEALRQDALKHHMIDQPGQLIALRLTEYYEMMNKGIVQPVVRVPAIALSAEVENSPAREVAPQATPTATRATPPAPASNSTSMPGAGTAPRYPQQMPTNGSFASQNQVTGRMRALQQGGENIIAASPNVEQNADEAADYWSAL
ncbi:hypothetical protein [Ktedonobacter racemifer]|jgi:hypothetical protein|uniref:Uncharacterized protein n=1 Tax=Ktedonobacter racemifer DSM 44963 TaxID=485913 RepID=D6TE20_KTERA|nr:hypothetical protein [Ktedonobacter racemifer]EFH88393.1 hypothetical protein Krac_9841 [Ktedonobacter racemifer DSM 44963]